MIQIQDMTAGELAALLHFHAEAGVEWLVEDEAIDRFAEFAAMQNSRKPSVTSQVSPNISSKFASAPAERQTASRTASAPPRSAETPVALPDERAVELARETAGRAETLEALKAALQAFTGCNLKNSARHTIFADGNAGSGIMIIGPMPTADDDREGIPFAGKQGQMLARMLGAIGLDRTSCLITHTIAWRPPGNRQPTAAEMEICRPFIERQIMLAKPKIILFLGNFAAKFFIDSPENIQTLRGKWRDISIGGQVIPAMPTLHPSDLMIAPVSKRLAWADLLAFQARLRDHEQSEKTQYE